jgi:hypothetical protein
MVEVGGLQVKPKPGKLPEASALMSCDCSLNILVSLFIEAAILARRLEDGSHSIQLGLEFEDNLSASGED